MPEINIEVEGLDKVIAKLHKFPVEIAKNFSAAGAEAAKDVILPTEGLQNYPPSTSANEPPVPYYIRGRGTQYATRNLMTSERLGTRWVVERKGFSTIVGNPVSYSRYVHGDEQARWMKAIGWKKLFDVAKEKIGDIKRVYQAWIDKTIKDLGL